MASKVGTLHVQIKVDNAIDYIMEILTTAISHCEDVQVRKTLMRKCLKLKDKITVSEKKDAINKCRTVRLVCQKMHKIEGELKQSEEALRRLNCGHKMLATQYDYAIKELQAYAEVQTAHYPAPWTAKHKYDLPPQMAELTRPRCIYCGEQKIIKNADRLLCCACGEASDIPK